MCVVSSRHAPHRALLTYITQRLSAHHTAFTHHCPFPRLKKRKQHKMWEPGCAPVWGLVSCKVHSTLTQLSYFAFHQGVTNVGLWLSPGHINSVTETSQIKAYVSHHISHFPRAFYMPGILLCASRLI